MKAYVLRNNELELMWAWEPESQPSDQASAASIPEIAGAAMSNGSAGPAEALPQDSHENNVGTMQTALGALDGAVRTTQQPDDSGPVELARTPAPPSPEETIEEWVQGAFTAIGGAVRQQEEEIQDLREQVYRAGAESRMWQTHIEMLQARLETLDGRVEGFSKSDAAVHDRELPDRAENTGVVDSAKLHTLESRVEELSQRLDVVTASQQATKEQEPVENMAALKFRLEELSQRLDVVAASQQATKEPDRVENTGDADSTKLRTLESRIEELSRRLDVAAALQQAAEEPDRVTNEAGPDSTKLRKLELHALPRSQRLDALAAYDQAIKEAGGVANRPGGGLDRVENTAQPDSATPRNLERSDVATASSQVSGAPEAAAASEPLRETASRRRSLLKPLIYVILAAGVPLAGLWSYTQRGMIDHFREPAPPAAFKATIPEPPLSEAPKVSEPAPPAEAPQRVSVVVTAKEATWLEAEADNEKVFAKMLQKNQVKSFDASQRIKIRTGNQAGTNVSYNGKEIAPLGSSHHSGTFLFTPQDWKRIAK